MPTLPPWLDATLTWGPLVILGLLVIVVVKLRNPPPSTPGAVA